MTKLGFRKTFEPTKVVIRCDDCQLNIEFASVGSQGNILLNNIKDPDIVIGTGSRIGSNQITNDMLETIVDKIVSKCRVTTDELIDMFYTRSYLPSVDGVLVTDGSASTFMMNELFETAPKGRTKDINIGLLNIKYFLV